MKTITTIFLTNCLFVHVANSQTLVNNPLVVGNEICYPKNIDIILPPLIVGGSEIQNFQNYIDGSNEQHARRMRVYNPNWQTTNAGDYLKYNVFIESTNPTEKWSAGTWN